MRHLYARGFLAHPEGAFHARMRNALGQGDLNVVARLNVLSFGNHSKAERYLEIRRYGFGKRHAPVGRSVVGSQGTPHTACLQRSRHPAPSHASLQFGGTLRRNLQRAVDGQDVHRIRPVLWLAQTFPVFHAGRNGRRTGRARSFNRRLGIDVLLSKPLPGPCASATSSPLPAWEQSESAPEPSSNEGSPACGETSPEDTLASKEPAYAIAEKGIIVTISKNAMNTLKSRSGNVRGVIRCAFFINFLTSLPHETSIAFIPSRSAISSNATYQ